MPTLALNKKIKADYQILEKIEAGIVLTGPEVKSVKASQINLTGSYVTIDKNQEAWLIGAHIAPYQPAASAQKNYQPDRIRKLLLDKKQIINLYSKIQTGRGLTILPLKVYTKGSFVKIEIGLARGKKKFDKREELKKREIERKIRKTLRKKQ